MQSNLEKELKIFSVGEFIGILNEILAKFQKVIIQGETGKVNRYSRQTYFDLLDKKEKAVLPCFIWNNQLENTGVELKEGMEIQVSGFPEIYKPKGSFHFKVEKINLKGEGILKQAFEALKLKLAKEGLFNPENKRPLPRFCQTIGLITSKFGKGAKPDFLKHLGNFGFKIYFYDTRVEGIYASEEITKAIEWFNKSPIKVEAIVITRGGGSWESLQAFNSESVAKAIYASRIPVICGIGHESDITIADMVSDVRASTPTDAAKILSDPWRMAKVQLGEYYQNINTNLVKTINEKRKSLLFLSQSIESNLVKMVETKRDKLRIFSLRLNLDSKLQLIKQSLKTQLSNLNLNFDKYLKIIYNSIKEQKIRLEMGNPELKLKQGYSITLDAKSKKIIKSADNLEKGEKIKTRFYKGTAYSEIIK